MRFNGKMKAITLSYDDGVTQDRRLVEMLNRYGLKATFNLNSARFGEERDIMHSGKRISHSKISPHEVASLYRGHEVAGHTLTHPNLCALSDEEVVRQVEEDRLALSALVGYEVIGMAYPGGHFDDRTAELIRTKTGVRYARTIEATGSFAPPQNLYQLHPTVFHLPEYDRMLPCARHLDSDAQLLCMAEEFLALEPETPQIFYIWGHSYEFDAADAWARMEDFCARIAGREDIFYGTNREVLFPEEFGCE